jgi:hypothetical protein
MCGEYEIINITQGACSQSLLFAQYSIVIDVSETGGGIGRMLDHIGDQKNAAQHYSRQVSSLMGLDLSVLYKVQAGQQQNSRTGVKDRMKKGKGTGVETKVNFCMRDEYYKGYRQGNSDRNDNDRRSKIACFGGTRMAA